MLNRTNRTLSASRNRLNLGLGTRSLASLAQVSFNDGIQTLHTRHVYPVVMRAGMVGDPVDPISIGRYGIPSIPGSPSVSPWLIASYAIRPRVDFATGLPSTGDWQVHSLGQPCHRLEEPGPRSPRLACERGRAHRKPFMGKRRHLQQGTGLVQAGDAKQATLGLVVAPAAAAGG
jgi:hypothetical protein